MFETILPVSKKVTAKSLRQRGDKTIDQPEILCKLSTTPQQQNLTYRLLISS